MAARTFILSPHFGQTSGSSNQTFMMSRAQFRRRTFTNPLSSPLRTGTAGGWGWISPVYFLIQPNFLRMAVEAAP